MMKVGDACIAMCWFSLGKWDIPWCCNRSYIRCRCVLRHSAATWLNHGRWDHAVSRWESFDSNRYRDFRSGELRCGVSVFPLRWKNELVADPSLS
ncbi:hypothetical protein LZ32DRAFT_306160 [Colletotrichum eremochloae]|nr:hypothetical protein LZ32DRAFT_306160 [Colletotrichum eremochloae]